MVEARVHQRIMSTKTVAVSYKRDQYTLLISKLLEIYRDSDTYIHTYLNLYIQLFMHKFIQKPLFPNQLARCCGDFHFLALISQDTSQKFLSTMDVDPRQYEKISVNENDSHNIVSSYLMHNCYKDTVESLVASTGTKLSSAQLEDMEKRKRIYNCALEGNVLEAIALTEQLMPDIFEKNKDMLFELLSLHFVELIRSSNCIEALEFAEAKLTPFGKVEQYVEKLQDIMALLAFKEPEKSPMFYLLNLEYRPNVADRLNRTILAHANLPSYSPLERLIQQTTVVRQCLNEEHGKVQSTFSLKEFLES